MKKRVPYEVIIGAKKGNENAIAYIVECYSELIDLAATRIRTSGGARERYIDEELREHIISDLLFSIVCDFNPDREDAIIRKIKDNSNK